MNKAQKIVLIVGTGLFIALGLFPPWTVDSPMGEQTQLRWILSPAEIQPADPTNPFDRLFSGTAEINFQLLFLLWFVIAVATGAAVVLLSDSGPVLSEEADQDVQEAGGN